MLLNVRSGTATLSSQTSTTLLVLLTNRCSSSTCQPAPGTTELVVPAASASLRNPSFPLDVTYRYPPFPAGVVSRSRSSVSWEPWLYTWNATLAYASGYVEPSVLLA